MGIRKLVLGIFVTIIGIFTIGCGSQKIEEPVAISITIATDKKEITADGIEKVIITAQVKDQFGNVMGGQQVDYYANNVKLESNIFTTVTAGTYDLKAVVGTIESSKVTITAKIKIVLSSIEIVPDKTIAFADNAQTIVFTTTAKYSDGSSKLITPASIQMKKSSTQAKTYYGTGKIKCSPAEFGEYDIVANYSGVVSNIVKVTFKEVPRIAEILVNGDKATIKADNTDKVTLSILIKDQYGNLFNNSSVLVYSYKDNIGEYSLSGNTFTAVVPGTYNVYAEKGGVKSTTPFTVTVVEASQIIEKTSAPILGAGGSLTIATQVEIPVIPGTSVIYTTDGTEPSLNNGTLISSSTMVLVDKSMEIRAIAIKNQQLNSDIVSVKYTLIGTVVKPIITNGGTFTNSISVLIKVEKDTTVRYTIDNTTPSYTNGIVLTADTTIQIATTTNLKAVAYKSSTIVSDVASSLYVILGKVSMPIIQSSKTFTTAVTIMIPVVEGTKVRYTLDGTTPSETYGTEITTNTSINISATTILKAIAYETGLMPSDIAVGEYIIKEKVVIPILPPDSTSTTAISVTIPVVSGTTVRYTLDMSNPSSTNGILITADTTLNITATTMIKAIAFKDGCVDSDIITGIYTISSVVVPANMVRVEAGTFTMGDTFGNGDTDEVPVHQVTLGYNFFMGQYEVTQLEYTDLMGTNPATGYGVGDSYPVYNVSWFDAIKYCNKISDSEKVARAYNETTGGLLDASGNPTTDVTKVVGYRLPTEAEWEYAARGGKKSQGYVYSGSNTIDNSVIYWDNFGVFSYTADITASKAPNELGIYDMSGNVWEWCSDFYDTYTSTAVINPYVTSGLGRVVRGGSWFDTMNFARVSFRDYNTETATHYTLGFRVVKTE